MSKFTIVVLSTSVFCLFVALAIAGGYVLYEVQKLYAEKPGPMSTMIVFATIGGFLGITGGVAWLIERRRTGR